LLKLGVLLFLSELLLEELSTLKPISNSSQHLRLLFGALDYFLLSR
jgi:hypothetical protein